MSQVKCIVCEQPSDYDFSGRDLMFDLYIRYDYYRCGNCEAVFQYPLPTPEQIASFYPKTYDIYDSKNQDRKLSQWKLAKLEVLADYSHLHSPRLLKILAKTFSRWLDVAAPYFKKGGHLLDVGCGNGRYLHTMARLGWRVSGIEFSEHGVKACQQANISVHHGDLYSAELPDNSVDVITARHIIEHVPNVHLFMQELSRILKPGGHLLIETPNSEALGRSIFSSKWFANEVPRHICLLSEHAIVTLAEKYNLNVVETKQQTSPKLFLNSIDYVITNKDRPSNKRKLRRLLAKPYVFMASYLKRGDVLQVIIEK